MNLGKEYIRCLACMSANIMSKGKANEKALEMCKNGIFKLLAVRPTMVECEMQGIQKVQDRL